MTTPSAAAVIALAKTQIGVHEGRDPSGNWNNDQKYSDETPGFDWSDGQPWCDTFVAWCSWKSGFSEDQWPRSASCDVSGSAFKNMGRWSEYPAIGVQVFFGTHSDLQHTGIVTKYDDRYIWTVEGNTNSSGSYQGDGVYAKMHERRDSRLIGYGYPKFPEGITSADPKWQTKPTPVPTPGPGKPRRLTLGTFNVERARPKNVAVGDVVRLFEKHKLDGLALQEAEQYFHELGGIPGLQLFADPENPENAILVPAGRGSDFLSADYGDGWTRAGGAHRGPGVFPRVTIDGWCRFASIHYPPSTTWPGGVLHTPDARRDDVVDIAEKAQAFLGRDNLTRVIGGDMNEPPETDGKWSPGWVAKQAGAKYAAPKSCEGHGRIDWAMVVRGHFEGMQKDLEIREGSDHEPVVFEVVES